MAVVEVRCPDCGGLNVVKYGKQPNGAQRYVCHNEACDRRIFLLKYRIQPKSTETRRRIIDMALNGTDVAETARLLKLPDATVMEVFQLLSRFSAPPAAIREPRQPAPRSLVG